MAAKKTENAPAAVKKTVVRRQKKTATEEMIRERAYFISMMSQQGSPLEHWLAAERELVGA